MSTIISKNHILAESPIYSAKDNILYWVDILGRKVFSYHLKKKKINSIKLKVHPSAIFLTNKKNTIIILSIKKIFITNFNYIKPLHNFSFASNYRTNDAKVISKKKIIFSIMDKTKKKLGSIYSFNFSTKKMKIIVDKIKIPNSIIKKNNYLFYADSAKGKIYKMNLNNKIKILFNKNNFKKSEPDGSVLARRNLVFNANFKCSTIDIYSIDGTLKNQIQLPCKNPTSLCFAGKKLNKIYITSAKTKNSKKIFDGSLFLIKNPLNYNGLQERILHV